MKDKKVFVTGGAGFIGSHIAEQLSNDNEVLVLDDLSTGREGNLSSFRERVKFHEGSILHLDLLREVMKDIDYVFHEAALPSVERSMKDPATTNTVNVKGTLNVLEAARENNVEKVVYASSSSVYGASQTLPKVETMPAEPISPYGVSKLATEHYCRVYNEIFDLRTTSLRYFNVYGPRQDPKSEYAAVVPRFITRALAGEKLIIYDDGNQIRDFTFVLDVVEANILAAENKDSDGEVLNVACGSTTKVNDLAEMVFELVGRNTGVEHAPPRPGEIRDSWADISKAKRLLGFDPKHSMRKGMEFTVESFRS
ncbi:MAG: SDR family oxidoreductase [Methanomassiliicoccales archaeon]|nr:MAG: SDR family oxidoreductase [Methanomassiliicoccales archaeon]